MAIHATEPNRQSDSVSVTSNADYPFHHESLRDVGAPAEALFAYLDDHTRLSSHMGKSSWMMAGSRMDLEVDALKGKAVGSHITLKGRFLGIDLHLEEAVSERTPPIRKTWQTLGEPRLLVVGAYRMGFQITPQGRTSKLRIFIDYALPQRGVSRLLGRALGRLYARWCTEKMAADSVTAFAPGEVRPTPHPN